MVFSITDEISRIGGMKLNFFFDVDGTLLPFGCDIPQSALDAISRAKREGHRIFVCTGRSRAELDPRLSVIPFDGGVFAGGSSVVYDGKEVARRLYTKEDVERVKGYLEKNGFLYLVQGTEGSYMDKASYEYFNNAVEKANGKTIDVPGLVMTPTLPENIDITKFIAMSPEGRMDEVRREFGEDFFVVDNTLCIPQSQMAEICLKGCDKGKGIEMMLSILGEKRESAVGVGDGANDMEMVEYSGLGVAMGNATDELKKAADFITTPAEKDGIYNAINYALDTYLPSLE